MAGTAFARLPGTAGLTASLAAALSAGDWPAREPHPREAYPTVAARHNQLGLTRPLGTGTRPFYDRPYQVIHASRFTAALREAITDPQIRRLPPAGAIDQFVDSTDAAGDLRFLRACAQAAWVGETPGRDGGKPHSACLPKVRTVWQELTDRSEGMMATDNQAEIAASVAALQDLGPGYDQALAEGLVERIGAEIDKRIAAEIDNRVAAEVDSRLLTQLDRYAGCRHQRRRAKRMIRAERRMVRAERADRSGRQSLVLALGSMLVTLAVTAIVLKGSPGG